MLSVYASRFGLLIDMLVRSRQPVGGFVRSFLMIEDRSYETIAVVCLTTGNRR